MRNKTKIVCTIGPSVQTLEKIMELIQCGMDVARLNFSHGTHEYHLANIELLKEARSLLGVPLAIMLDTKGPEIRIGKLLASPLQLKTGMRWILIGGKETSRADAIPVHPANILDPLQPGMHVLFDDGAISSKVIERVAEGVMVEIENDGIILSSKGVNIPEANLNLPAMTEQDVRDLTFGAEHDVDLVAASFICSADHVLQIKKLLNDLGKPEIQVLAKIENIQGVTDLDNIIQVSDGIMVARGDLGVELPLREVPRLQKLMIRKCIQAGKPIVTATQMLESMIERPRPTRAEVSDVANAIYDSSSAVMLSGETAVGKYPFQTVKMMASIARESERDFDYQHFFSLFEHHPTHDSTSSIAFAAVHTAYSSNATAIFLHTSSGLSPRLLSRLRPRIPIFALTTSKKVYNQMSLIWGVTPLYAPEVTDSTQAFEILSKYALEEQRVRFGDNIIMLMGDPFGVPKRTNTISIKSIGNVALRGSNSMGELVQGELVTLYGIKDGHKTQWDPILLLTKYDHSYKLLLKEIKGVILQNHLDDQESERLLAADAKLLGISVLFQADDANALLKAGQLITLDPEHRTVYYGHVAPR
jgi:pyruvate kinase